MDDTTLAEIMVLAPANLKGVAAIAVTGFLAVSGLCAILDANLPQPAAGSRWVAPRRVLAWLGHNYRFARNALPAGLPPRDAALVRAVDKVVTGQATPIDVAVAKAALPAAASPAPITPDRPVR